MYTVTDYLQRISVCAAAAEKCIYKYLTQVFILLHETEV